MEQKLSIKEKLEYSSASIADAMAYHLVGAYFLFYVTTIAGVQPRNAGILTGIGAVQPETALHWIFNACTLLPCAFILIAMLLIWKYPITREMHHDIIRRLAERRDL